METVKSLASTIADLTTRYNPGPHVRDVLSRVLAADHACSLRRTAVLAHPDLAGMLTKPPLGYSRPEQWNGWVPPEWVNVGEPELCRHSSGDRVTLNQRGAYSTGESRNDSAERAALIEIVQEAWNRENALDESVVHVRNDRDDIGHEPPGERATA